MAGCNSRHYNLQDNVFELFLLADGEKKIEEKVYSGMSNTSDFILNKEDHTLGNLLSEHIKKHPNVYMAGYKLAHPNVPQLFIRVQTDGSKTPREVFCAVCEKLINQLELLHQAFTREWELRRITNIGEQAMQANGHQA
ncbi:DNA-directed RNA polymerase II subunit RPB11 [Ophiocordyceps camponoti-floridani]|uniref:DNA-directed RNA polymerase II subunit RPB11 n=1 Tax=Ophiocordyceps camponoti-floridani TaxID=2030778 RepID=A0A8H4QCH4_9HYPO|nr:DNA-directed RNA polymerase II subunit RPB11 [Ophiocordyceps camponoti-floridani]